MFFAVWGPTSQCDILGGNKYIGQNHILNADFFRKTYLFEESRFGMNDDDVKRTNCSIAMLQKSLDRFNRRNCSWEIAVDIGLLPNLRLFSRGIRPQALDAASLAPQFVS